MNHKFNGAIPCTPKKLAKQLLVESAKLLNHEQRQALLDIFKTLDQAEDNSQDTIHCHIDTKQRIQHASQNYAFQDHDELNQEYWSGQHYDSDNQEYYQDWLRRTQQRPHRKLSDTAY